MRILHVVPTYAPGFRYGGPVASVRGLAEAQARRGDLVTVATTDRDDGVRLDAPESELLGGVLVRRFAVRGPERLRRAPTMSEWLERATDEFDVVHAHGVFVWTTTASLRAARRCGAPTVLAPRGMLMRDVLGRHGTVRKRLWLAGPERANLAALDALHLTASNEVDELPSGLASRARRLVVPNGVAHDAWDGSLDGVAPAIAELCASGRPFALFLGRLNWKKGLDVLVDALARTREELELVLAGPDDGYGDAVLRRARRAGVAGRCHAVGAVTGRAKAALLAHARAVALCSSSENFGNSALEALAAGCPALVTEGVGAAEAVRALDGGLVCAADPAQIASGLEELAFGPAWRAERTRLARRTHASYGWDAIATAMADAYGAIGARGWRRSA